MELHIEKCVACVQGNYQRIALIGSGGVFLYVHRFHCCNDLGRFENPAAGK